MTTKMSPVARLKVQVENMQSVTGREVPNQFLIYTKDGVYFQSYSSIIAFKGDKTGKIYLDEEKWDYSRTTSKYRRQFLGEDIEDTRSKIESGEYILTDLN